MELKNYSTIAISSILAFALITATATTGIPPTSFENAFAQGENTTGMSQDQTSEGEESTAFNPEEIIKKEARGLGNADLGEVQEISGEFIVTQKGTVDKDVFYIPKNLVDHFDGSTVFFTVTEEEVKQYKRD
jgi:hypothetical protein